MIILTDKKLVIPVGIAPNYAGAGNTDIKLQSKSVTINENGSKSLFPDDNYDGFSQVNITTNVTYTPVLEDKEVEIIENGDYRFTPSPAYDGIGNFKLKVNVETYDPIPVQSVKTVYPSFEEDVEVIPSEGYEAMSSVIVKKAEVNLQDKTVDKASTAQIVLRPDSGYQGLGTVTIAPIKTTRLEINPSARAQEFRAEDNNYIDYVYVYPVLTSTISFDPSTNEQVFSADVENNRYIENVIVGPVTASIDENIIPENIAKGINILGVDGTLEAASSDIEHLIQAKGAPYSAKLKVYEVYLEDKNDSLYGAYYEDEDLRSGAAGTSGYIPFFMKNVGGNTPNLISKFGTLEERGIIAVVVNGVIYENPTSFNVPYTKVNADGIADDVTIDVYIDFEKANAIAEIIENGSATGTDSKFDVNTYRYLPPIFNENNTEYVSLSKDIVIYETVETYVREQVNALSKYFVSNFYGTSVYAGNMTFLLGEGGMKRVAATDGNGNIYAMPFNKVTFYGDVNDYNNIATWLERSDDIVVYGDVNDFNPTTPLPESSKSTTFFGKVNTPEGYYDEYKAQFMGVDSSICDFGENITTNPTSWKGSNIKADVVIMPKSLENLYANYSYQLGKYRWYQNAKTYVFFGETPPSMPGQQIPLRKGSSSGDWNPLTTIYKPVGADYSSILYDVSDLPPEFHDQFLPTIIDFIPVSSTDEINGPGIYGLTDYRGYHSLIEIKASTQAEVDIETIASEINTL